MRRVRPESPIAGYSDAGADLGSVVGAAPAKAPQRRAGAWSQAQKGALHRWRERGHCLCQHAAGLALPLRQTGDQQQIGLM